MSKKNLKIVRILGEKWTLAENILNFYEALKISGCMKDYTQCVFLYDYKLRFETGVLISELKEKNSDILCCTFDQLPELEVQAGAVVYIPENLKDFTHEYKDIFSRSFKLLAVASSNLKSKAMDKIPDWSSLFTNLQTDFVL